jgi:hypothetical protein
MFVKDRLGTRAGMKRGELTEPLRERLQPQVALRASKT